METSAIAVQVGITVFSGAAAWMTNDHRAAVRKWAPLIGLLSQPFWIAWAWQTQAFGAGIISVWYTYCWIRGIRNNWFKGDE
jgi:hypothetical protein